MEDSVFGGTNIASVGNYNKKKAARAKQTAYKIKSIKRLLLLVCFVLVVQTFDNVVGNVVRLVGVP
ncbi:MAG: hypothetical protein IKP62_09950, partial [Salinivirgaceae bacterium]|nr:hypothetical protein [Salinivirgaceae bacterium]